MLCQEKINGCTHQDPLPTVMRLSWRSFQAGSFRQAWSVESGRSMTALLKHKKAGIWPIVS
jgi:hypothetical protein